MAGFGKKAISGSHLLKLLRPGREYRRGSKCLSPEVVFLPTWKTWPISPTQTVSKQKRPGVPASWNLLSFITAQAGSFQMIP